MSLFRHHVTFLFGDKVPHWPRAHHIGGQPGGGGLRSPLPLLGLQVCATETNNFFETGSHCLCSSDSLYRIDLPDLELTDILLPASQGLGL